MPPSHQYISDLTLFVYFMLMFLSVIKSLIYLFNYYLLQWNLDLTNSLGTGQICLLNRGFIILRFFFIYFTITGAKNTVRYIEVFVK